MRDSKSGRPRKLCPIKGLLLPAFLGMHPGENPLRGGYSGLFAHSRRAAPPETNCPYAPNSFRQPAWRCTLGRTHPRGFLTHLAPLAEKRTRTVPLRLRHPPIPSARLSRNTPGKTPAGGQAGFLPFDQLAICRCCRCVGCRLSVSQSEHLRIDFDAVLLIHAAVVPLRKYDDGAFCLHGFHVHVLVDVAQCVEQSVRVSLEMVQDALRISRKLELRVHRMDALYAGDVVGKQAEAGLDILQLNLRVPVDDRADEGDAKPLSRVAYGVVNHIVVDSLDAAFPLDFTEPLNPEGLRIGRQPDILDLFPVVRSLH